MFHLQKQWITTPIKMRHAKSKKYTKEKKICLWFVQEF